MGVDRVVQEAVRRVLEPRYESRLHASSHGFRPGRSCRTAITEAKGYLKEGCGFQVASCRRSMGEGKPETIESEKPCVNSTSTVL